MSLHRIYQAYSPITCTAELTNDDDLVLIDRVRRLHNSVTTLCGEKTTSPREPNNPLGEKTTSPREPNNPLWREDNITEKGLTTLYREKSSKSHLWTR